MMMSITQPSRKFPNRSLIFLTMILLPQVFTMAEGWNNPFQLTINLTDEFQPSLSSSGNRIAFVSNQTGGPELFVIDSDGTNLRQLTFSRARECCPSISGDGTRIVFQSDLRGDEEIFLIDADGTIPSSCSPSQTVADMGCQLTNNRDDDVSPVMSDDGSKVAFVSNRDGDPEVFVANSDGTGLQQLTFNEASDENPSINRDGSKIAFDSNVGVDYEIFIVRSDGTGLRQLTDNFSNEDRFPSISLDGSKIVFASTGPAIAQSRVISGRKGPGTTGPDQAETSVVMIVNSDGTGLRVLTPNSAYNSNAALSGDGRVVSFVSNMNGPRDIYRVMADGTGLVRTTSDSALDLDPRLDLDGSMLVYVSDRDGDFEIYAVCTMVGDVNQDGAINIFDLVSIGSAFGTSAGNPGYSFDADVNRDGTINILDLVVVGSAFGRSCPS